MSARGLTGTALGTDNSPGTKLFAVTGHVRRPGVFEAPFGVTLRQVLRQFAGGMRAGSTFKMALVGGAAGTIVGPEHLDISLDFAAVRQGVSLGAGAILIMDQSASVLSLLGWLLHFFEVESCGKCTPCRAGTRRPDRSWIAFRPVLPERPTWTNSDGWPGCCVSTSLCGLGQSVAWPLESALANFPLEWNQA